MGKKIDPVKWFKKHKNDTISPKDKNIYDQILRSMVVNHLDKNILPKLESEAKRFVLAEVEELTQKFEQRVTDLENELEELRLKGV